MPKRNHHRLYLTASLANVLVLKKDVKFFVYHGPEGDDDKIGELRVSQGGLVWYGRHDKRGRKVGWERFARFMESSNNRSESRTRSEPKSVPRGKRA
ncbi:MAG: hypothetical protein ACO3IB_07365 [Phycisphaerales bacterium]